MIPTQYTCDGKNVSLPLAGSGFPGFPATAKILVLIPDDPDSPVGTWHDP
jgi:phosphatidylethanolamine-binding protein (PEBP) family uncharacterized protein